MTTVMNMLMVCDLEGLAARVAALGFTVDRCEAFDGATQVHVSEDLNYVQSQSVQAAIADQRLQDVKDSRLEFIRNVFDEEIARGFDSSALGGVHHYGGSPEDQMNLIGAASTGVGSVFWVVDEDGSGSHHIHSAAQITQVLQDGAAFKQSAAIRRETRYAQIAAAVDEAAVVAIDW